VGQQVAVEQRLALLSQAQCVVDLVARHHAVQKLHMGRRNLRVHPLLSGQKPNKINWLASDSGVVLESPICKAHEIRGFSKTESDKICKQVSSEDLSCSSFLAMEHQPCHHGDGCLLDETFHDGAHNHGILS